ncbi:hypothetical protein Tco_0937108 [Tanacetum coccineum]|uniref:Uncharacterized protein n=1 Tax=Tanacetum coccineum TaxID=301880 RepID=A0ABQ5DG25_9ASTR
MPHPSRYFKLPKTSMEEMMREWMARQMEANEHMKNQKTPSFRNENDKGNVKAIEAGKTKLIPTMPNPNCINPNSPTVSPFLKDSTVHIPYTNAKMFADVVLPNHVGDKELKSIDGVRNGRMTKKEINKDDVGLPKKPNKE